MSPSRALSRLLVATLASATVTLVGAPALAAPADPQTLTFNYTGASQTWVVPDDVATATFDLYGAQGAGEGNGGLGGRVTATVPVTPGEVVTIVVGGEGGHMVVGFNGGGDGWHAGGGATDIRIDGTDLEDRLLVAGGGGASGSFCGDILNRGGHGGEIGLDGSPNAACSGVPGGGAQADAGGVNSTDATLNGSAGQGGGRPGGFGNAVSGGGGGWFGGAGALNATAGGGSSHGPAGTVFETGARIGGGLATVTFTPSAELTVAASGTGAGTVTSTPVGIDCGSACSARFDLGTDVTLTATPDSASTFSGWSGACTGTGDCTVTMDQARDVTAAFTVKQMPLTVTKAGTGAGSVNSAPDGMDCATTCSATFAHGTEVVLTATADASSTFTGWSGACAGTGVCAVTMDQARDVTVTYATVPTPVPTVPPAPAASPSVAPAPVVNPAKDPAPQLSDLRVDPKRFVGGKPTRTMLHWRVSEDVMLSVRLRQIHQGEVRGPYYALPTETKAGTGTFRLRGDQRPGQLRPGRYRLTLVATDSAGQRDRERVYFQVRR